MGIRRRQDVEECGTNVRWHWDTIAALVPGRTKRQCCKRWCDALDPSICGATARTGKLTADEDKKLKDAVPIQGDKNWVVPGRTRRQCCNRWHVTLDSNIDPTTARLGKWTTEEDKNLKDAVPTHGGKNWGAIAALVPGRTKSPCSSRWHVTLVP
jgi:hypothetical protein